MLLYETEATIKADTRSVLLTRHDSKEAFSIVWEIDARGPALFRDSTLVAHLLPYGWLGCVLFQDGVLRAQIARERWQAGLAWTALAPGGPYRIVPKSGSWEHQVLAPGDVELGRITANPGGRRVEVSPTADRFFVLGTAMFLWHQVRERAIREKEALLRPWPSRLDPPVVVEPWPRPPDFIPLPGYRRPRRPRPRPGKPD